MTPAHGVNGERNIYSINDSFLVGILAVNYPYDIRSAILKSYSEFLLNKYTLQKCN